MKSGILEFSIGKVKLVDKALFVKHLSTMIKSGINLNEALEVIAEQTSSKKFSRVIFKIIDKVKTGQSLGSALSSFPKEFDPFFINIIKIGEESGTLEDNLNYLADEMEDRIELQRNIKGAAFYPAIIFASTIGLGLILAYFVLPKITRLFKTLSFELPLSTKILLGVAELMENHGNLVVLGFIGSIIFFRILIAQKFVKPLWHSLLIKMPIIGGIIINYNLVLIHGTLAILLKSGLTIDQAMKITTDTTSNLVYHKKLKLMMPEIQKGKSISNILLSFKQSKRKPLFPLLSIKMIGVGEKSGRLDESLGYLSEYFEKEMDNTPKNLTTVLEPILLIMVGLIVGFVAISVISPIYQITGKFRR